MNDVAESLSYLTYDSSIQQNEILIQSRLDIERIRKSLDKCFQAIFKELTSQKDQIDTILEKKVRYQAKYKKAKAKVAELHANLQKVNES